MAQDHRQGGSRVERPHSQQQRFDSGGNSTPDISQLLSANDRVDYFAPNSSFVKPQLLAETAENVARKLASFPSSQLRRFYGEVVALKRRVELANASDAEIQAAMTMLRARAAYTLKRGSHYPGELVSFFNRHARSVQNKKDFLQGFQPHFEAVMAFHKVFETKGGRG